MRYFLLCLLIAVGLCGVSYADENFLFANDGTVTFSKKHCPGVVLSRPTWDGCKMTESETEYRISCEKGGLE